MTRWLSSRGARCSRPSGSASGKRRVAAAERQIQRRGQPDRQCRERPTSLSVPVEILDDGDLIEDANVLVSEHVLARDGDRIAFFHETFFDYAFARQWVSRAESLVDFLLRDEQELFRRAQVRQILQHLYEREPDRFRVEAEAVLTQRQSDSTSRRRCSPSSPTLLRRRVTTPI